jgi:hypothetical protein
MNGDVFNGVFMLGLKVNNKINIYMKKREEKKKNQKFI